MTDQECLELLRLLHKYVTEYPATSAYYMTVEQLASDCVQSLDITSDEADRLYKEIALY